MFSKTENKTTKDNLIECQICQALFSRKYMATHIATIHGEKKSFRCSVCEYTSSHKSGRTYHIASVHEGKKPYKCSKCDYYCSVKGSLTKHIASIHEGNKPFMCFICDTNVQIKET